MIALSVAIAALFAIAALALFVPAIRLSYRIERMKQPDLPRPRMVYTNIFASAFGAPPHEEGAKSAATLRGLLLACVLLLVTGAAAAFILRQSHDPLAGVHALDFMPEGAFILEPESTLHYTRANQDGTMPERVLMHVVSDREVVVARLGERCADAALVTARFDPRTGEAVRLVGGRLGRDGEQVPQAFLDFDARSRQLAVRLGADNGEPAETLDAPAAPWRMYDFDLAELALYGPRLGEPFSFGLAMAWPDGSQPLVRMLGAARAEPVMATARMNRPVTMYAVTGDAFGGDEGEDGGLVMVDTEYGFVVEARLGRPNHTGYDDFHLKLDFVDFGEDNFRYDLRDHWAGCPAGEGGE